MVSLQNMTIGDALAAAAREYGQNIAIEYGGVSWNYQEVNKATDELAKGFLALGVRRGTHVGIWADLEPNIIFTYYALQKIGAVAVMLYTNLTHRELWEQLIHAQCKFLFAGKPVWDTDTVEVCHRLEQENVCRVVCIGTGVPSTFRRFRSIWSYGKNVSVTALIDAKAQVTPQDISTILFTSGTRGKSKAVLSTQYAWLNCGSQQAQVLGATGEDRFCVVLPMFHCFCLSANVIAALVAGACLHILEDRHTITILQAVQKKKCTILNAVPTVFFSMSKRADLAEYDLSSLRIGIIGGNTYAPEQFVSFEKALGIRLISSLGLTEATAGITFCSAEDSLAVRSTTVGRFAPHLEGRIADIQSGQSLPAGQAGEICVRGYLVMKGYYQDDAETARAIDAEGWLHTGDCGWLDEDGNVHMCGRLKDLIIRAGENISPVEINNVLLADSRIQDSQVIGVPDERFGEQVCACVVPRPGVELTEDDCRAIVAAQLSDYKVPRYVMFLDKLPRNYAGKVLVGTLRENFLASQRCH